MVKKSRNRYSTNLDFYDKLIDTHPNIERKGKTMPYTSINGHMFSILNKDGSLGLRLPKDERDNFIDKYNTSLHESYGAIMKEYVRVPDSILGNTEELLKYLNISFYYTKSLKPKATKKK